MSAFGSTNTTAFGSNATNNTSGGLFGSTSGGFGSNTGGMAYPNTRTVLVGDVEHDHCRVRHRALFSLFPFIITPTSISTFVYDLLNTHP